MSDIDLNWEKFIKSMCDARSKVNMAAVPTQIVAMRDGDVLGFGGLRDADSDDQIRAVIAILGGFGCSGLFMGCDSYYGGPDGINPETGERWESGEMEFDFRENPNSIVKEGLLFFQIDKTGTVVQSGSVTYTRDEKGYPNEFTDMFDLDQGFSETFQKAMNQYLEQLPVSLKALFDLTDEVDGIDPAAMAVMDMLASKALQEANPALQWALMFSDDDSPRSVALKEAAAKGGFDIQRPEKKKEGDDDA